MLHKLLVLLSLFITLVANAQKSQEEDSIKHAIAIATNDTSKVNAYLKLSEFYDNKDSLKNKQSLFAALKIIEPTNYIQHKARVYFRIANYYSNRNSYLSLSYFYKSSVLYEKIKVPRLLANAYNMIGARWDDLGNYGMATEYYFKSLKIAETTKDTAILAGLMNNMAILYSKTNNSKKAIDYYLKSIEFSTKSKTERGICINYLNLGITYQEINNFEDALKYDNLAIETATKENQQDIVANAYSDLGVIYRKMKNFQLSKEYFQKSVDLFLKLNDYFDLGYTYKDYGDYFVDIKDYNNAAFYFEKAFENGKKFHFVDLVQKSSQKLMFHFKALKNFENAFQYFSEYKDASDSLSSAVQMQKITQIEMQFDFDKQQQIEKDNDIKLSKEITMQRTIIISIVAVMLIIIILTGFLYRNYKEKKKAIQDLSERNAVITQQNDEIHAQSDAISLQTDELRKSHDELVKINTAKDKFFSIIAHDLRNPFAVFLEGTRILVDNRKELGNDEWQDYIRGLNFTAERTFALLENLLDWSRANLGRLECNPIEFDVNKIITNNIELFKKTASSKSISVTANLSDNCFVYVDYNMINTVIRNLISNALKFTPPKGSVIVKTNLIDVNTVEIAVIDTGFGLREEDTKRLFRKDVKNSEIGISAEGKGTGLGLAICKEFVDINKGIISVESKPGQGSTFFVRLPASKKG